MNETSIGYFVLIETRIVYFVYEIFQVAYVTDDITGTIAYFFLRNVLKVF